MLTGKELKKRRKELGITQRDLHAATGVGLTTISQFENGQISPNTRTVQRLEAVLCGKKPSESPALSVDEAFILLAHELEALAILIRDPSITPATKRQKLDSFAVGYIQGTGRDIPTDVKESV